MIISLIGELDHHNAKGLREYMDHRLEDPSIKHIIVDMKGLSFMDSSGIGVLIGRYKRVSGRGGKFGVIHIKPQVHRIFEISGLYSILRTYDTLEEALDDIGGN